MKENKIVVETEECTATFTVKGNSIHITKTMNENYKPKNNKEIKLMRF